MTYSVAKDRLHSIIEKVPEEQLMAIYSILEKQHLFEADNDLEGDDVDNDWFDKLNSAQMASIASGIKDMENGDTIPHEEIVKLYSKWLSK